MGSYVYFLCCAADSPDSIYVKIGVSDIPTDRLFALVNNCGLRALSFGTVHIYSRHLAFHIEKLLHRKFKEWRTRGEWFRFTIQQKEHFAKTRDAIFDKYRRIEWPMKVEMVNVPAFMRAADRRANFWRKKNMRYLQA